MKPVMCCGEDPIFWEPAPFDITNIEKIECAKCGRIVYGSDEECIIDWNNGVDDK